MKPFASALRWTRSSLLEAAGAASRFPVTVLAVLAFSFLSNLDLVQGDLSSARLLAALSGGAALSLAAVLALEARGATTGVRWAAACLAFASAALLIYAREPVSLYGTMVLAAALLAVPVAPFLGKGTAAEFWSFSLWTGVGVVLAFFGVLVFCLGVQAILEMVRYLFDVGIARRAEQHLLLTAFTLVGPLLALGRIPRPDEPQSQPIEADRLVRTVRPLFEWVLAPLILVAAGVLHVYALRIVVTGDVPRNQIGWVVGIYTLLLLQLRIALDPFRTDPIWPARMVRRVWPVLLVVPLLLLCFALMQRVGAEGMTLSRYVLALGLVGAGLAMLAQLHPRWRGDVRVLAALPALLLALASFGPWGVGASVARSQVPRIEADLAASRAAGNEAAGLTMAQRERLRSRLSALDAVGRLDDARPVLPADAVPPQTWDEPQRSVASIVARFAPPPDAVAPEIQIEANAEDPVDVSGYDRAFLSLRPGGSTMLHSLGGAGFLFAWNGVSDRFDLSAALASAPGEARPARVELRTLDGRAIAVRIEEGTVTPSGEWRQVRLTLLLREAEWRR